MPSMPSINSDNTEIPPSPKFISITGSVISNNIVENNSEIGYDVTYDKLVVSWYELAIPVTILSVSILSILCIGVTLILWIKKQLFKTFSKTNLEATNTNEDIVRIINQTSLQSEENTSKYSPRVSLYQIPPTTSKSLYPQQPSSSSLSNLPRPFPFSLSSSTLNILPSILVEHGSPFCVPGPVAITAHILPVSQYDILYKKHGLSPEPIYSIKSSILKTRISALSTGIKNTLTSSATHSALIQRTILKQQRVEKISQTELKTPPIQPPLPPPQPSSLFTIGSSLKRYSVSKMPKPLEITQSLEWILHDSKVMAISQQQSDVCCVQPQITSTSSTTPAMYLTTVDKNVVSFGVEYNPNLFPTNTILENKENACPYKAGKSVTNNVVVSASSSNSSPKLIHQFHGVDNTLFQQKSPRMFDPINSHTSKEFQQIYLDDGSNASTSIRECEPLSYPDSSPMNSAGYKNGQYFRFPEVDIFTSPNAYMDCRQSINRDTKLTNIMPNKTEPPHDTVDMKSKNVYESENGFCLNDIDLVLSSHTNACVREKLYASKIHCIENPNGELNTNIITKKKRETRSIRLKSMSLDSDDALIIQDNWTAPVYDIPITTSSSDIYNNNDVCKMFSKNISTDVQIAETKSLSSKNNLKKIQSMEHIKPSFKSINRRENIITHTYNTKNKKKLTIKLFGNSNNTNDFCSHKTIAKTPTLTQSRQKAISLDSEPVNLHTVPSNSSSILNLTTVSEPTTPKRKNKTKQTHSITDCDEYIENTNENPMSSDLSHNFKDNNRGFMMLKLNKFKNTKEMHSKKQLGSVTDNNLPRQICNSTEKCFTFIQKLNSFTEKKNAHKKTGSVPNICTNTLNSAVLGMHLGIGTNLQYLKSSPLNVSNNNLKTLPEVIPQNAPINYGNNNVDTNAANSQNNMNISSTGNCVNSKVHSNLELETCKAHNILQRRSSNHSLSLNVGSVNNLNHGLSASNYSLGNLKGSHGSSSGFSFNLENTPNVLSMKNKQNLLQRRGSNTSLTLNIKECNNTLNRFNSHSSLNINDGRHKKGLLERRNSNASLTLNIQNRGLSVSNCNLRDSECSLNSINTNNIDLFEQIYHKSTDNCIAQTSDVLSSQKYYRDHPMDSKPQFYNFQQYCQESTPYRKFLSSENLHNYAVCSIKDVESKTISSGIDISSTTHTLRQPQYHHGSAANLEGHKKDDGKISNMILMNSSDADRSNPSNLNKKHQCHCGMRNITTKPLSPQTTSEDFKVYLANIQMLQNASNVLNIQKLQNLSYIFQKIYKKITTRADSKQNQLTKHINQKDENQTNYVDFEHIIDEDETTFIINSAADKNIETMSSDEMPSDDTQKLILQNLHQEFWDLPTNYQEKPLVFGSHSKNRYKTILPNEHSRVILNAESGQSTEPYINANFIKVNLFFS